MDPTDQTPDVPETLTPQAAPPTTPPAPTPPEPSLPPAPEAQPSPGEQVRRRALANVMQALDQAPVGETDPDRLAAALGWPVPAVQADPDWSWRHLKLRDAGPIVKSATGLAAWLADDPYNAVIGHRHLEPLAQAEGSVRQALAALDGAAEALKSTGLPGSPGRLEALIGRLMQNGRVEDGSRQSPSALAAYLAAAASVDLHRDDDPLTDDHRAYSAAPEYGLDDGRAQEPATREDAVGNNAPIPPAAQAPGQLQDVRGPIDDLVAASQAMSADGGARLERIDDSQPFDLDPDGGGKPDALVAKLALTMPETNPFPVRVDQYGRILQLVPDGVDFNPKRGAGGLAPRPGLHWEPVDGAKKRQVMGWLLGLDYDVGPNTVSRAETEARLALTPADQARVDGAPALSPPGEVKAKPQGPSSATVSGNTVTYRNDDGTTFSQTGTHPNRDNNPMNLYYGPLARRHGSIGRDGPFAIFPTEEQGYAANMANHHRIATTVLGKSNTSGQPDGSLAAIIYISSPPNENKTEKMITYIMSKTGLSRDSQYESLSDTDKLRFAHAYGRREGYKDKRMDATTTP